MPRFFALVIFLAAAAYLMREYSQPPQPAAPPGPPPMADPSKTPLPMFTDKEVVRIRLSLQDADPGVRWSAVQLLYGIHDPQLPTLLEKLIAEDPDPELRVKVVGLMKDPQEMALLGPLVKGLHDIDKNVRIASLNALADIGDPSVSTWVTALLKDPEPEVKVAALQTLGRFQEKRKLEFQALAEKLRKDYDDAQKRAAERH